MKIFYIPLTLSFAFLSSFTVAGSDLDVHAFASYATSGSPEVNLVIFNQTKRIRKVQVRFRDPEYIDSSVCKITSNIELNDISLGFKKLVNGYQYLSSEASIPANSFAHRFVSLHTLKSDSCFVHYIIEDVDNNVLYKGKLKVGANNRPTDFQKITRSDLQISISVDRVTNYRNLLATLLIKNKSEKYGNIFVSRKFLTNCSASVIGFDFRHPVAQGLDGSLIEISPGEFAVAMTPLSIADKFELKDGCELNLEIALVDSVRGQTEELRTDGVDKSIVLDVIKIPLRNFGVFERALPIGLQLN